MRQIINVQLGQCGNQLGLGFLQTISKEHRINSQGLYQGSTDGTIQRTNVFFNEVDKNYYTARTVLADLEPGSIDSARASSVGKLYNPDNFVVGLGSAGNNWAVGYYGKGLDLIEVLMDKIRNQADQCDHLEGIQLQHSISGGTGSGLGSLLTEKIKDEYPSVIVRSFTVFPSKSERDIVVDSYNAVLSMHRLVWNEDVTHVYQNQAMLEFCKKKLKIQHPNYGNINALVSQVMSNVTSGLRFPGELNMSLRKQAVNLVPFPRLHFFMDSVSSITHTNTYQKQTVAELFCNLLNHQNVLCDADPNHSRYLTGSATVRGKVSIKQVQAQCFKFQNRSSSPFVEWISNNIQCSLCNIPLPGQDISGTYTANSFAMQEVFRDVNENFGSLWRRKAFVHWYTAEGMEQMEFTEAESNLNDLISEHEERGVEEYNDDSQYSQSYNVGVGVQGLLSHYPRKKTIQQQQLS